jgi:hypothetical protein
MEAIGIALWYALFDRPARTASRQWLRVVHGSEPTRSMVYAHILRFAQTVPDRIFLLMAGASAPPSRTMPWSASPMDRSGGSSKRRVSPEPPTSLHPRSSRFSSCGSSSAQSKEGQRMQVDAVTQEVADAPLTRTPE